MGMLRLLGQTRGLRRTGAEVWNGQRAPFGASAAVRAEESDSTAEERKKEADRLFRTIFGTDSADVDTTGEEGEGDEKAAKVNSLFASIFGTRQNKTALRDLKYLQFYPATVRKWVVDAKTPLGYYDETGYWVPVGQQFQYSFSEEDSNDYDDADVPSRKLMVGKGRLRMERKMYPPQEKTLLEADLHGKYRFGISPEEVADFPEQLKKVLSFVYANNYEINELRREAAIHKWRKKPGDTGSSQVQIAVLTERIRYLTKHSETHPKDQSCKRGLQKAVTRRKALLAYLKRRDVVAYMDLLKDLNLRMD